MVARLAPFGVVITAAAVNAVQAIAASATKVKAKVRRVTATTWSRSINGTTSKSKTARPGNTRLPTTSSEPLKNFSV